jgi:hypothetical protein
MQIGAHGTRVVIAVLLIFSDLYNCNLEGVGRPPDSGDKYII